MQMQAPDRAFGADIQLSHPGWKTVGTTHALGQAYLQDELLRADEIARRLSGIADRDLWCAEVAKLNGSFAIVDNRYDALRAAVDRLRSVPLFYTTTGSMLRISDCAKHLLGKDEPSRLDDECTLEFEHVGYVTGEQTLIPGLRQVRAGHTLHYVRGTRSEPQQIRYYEYLHRDFLDCEDGALVSRLSDIHERLFQRLLQDVGDRQIVIPLSGGYDSRLIGHSLRELGARNVLCYTYGLRGNWESEISRELAQHLGFDWAMVTYSAAGWRAVAKDPAFKQYFADAANFASLAHIQDWPAVQSLKNEGRIAPDAVFVPGHSGDFLAGSHIPKRFAHQPHVSREELLEALLDVHYSLWDWPRDAATAMKRVFAARIERVVGPLAAGSSEVAADTFERWDCEERQAKFIVNAVRTYDFFGFEWRLPLFDSELMDFWSRIRLDGRASRRLYFEFVRRCQRLPVTAPNSDRGPLLTTAVRLLAASRLRGTAIRARRRLKRMTWRRQYDHGDLGWFALVEPAQFRRRYTGRENGHAFFALKYLQALREV
jgi:asparagine synthase (glutamine-hydrolysing)